MNKKTVVLFFVAVTAGVFIVTRFKTALPSDLRDAVNSGSSVDDNKSDPSALAAKARVLAQEAENYKKFKERYKESKGEDDRFKIGMDPDEAYTLTKCVADASNPTVFSHRTAAECDRFFAQKAADVRNTVESAAFNLHNANITSDHEDIAASDELGKILKGPVRLGVFQELAMRELKYNPGFLESLDASVNEYGDNIYSKVIRYQFKISEGLLGGEKGIFTITKTSNRNADITTIDHSGRYTPQQHVTVIEHSTEQLIVRSAESLVYKYVLSPINSKPSEISVTLEDGRIVSADSKNIEDILEFSKANN